MRTALPQVDRVEEFGVVHEPRPGQVAAADEDRRLALAEREPDLRVEAVGAGDAGGHVVAAHVAQRAGLDQRPPEPVPVGQEQAAPQRGARDPREDQCLEEGEAQGVARAQDVRRPLEQLEEVRKGEMREGDHGGHHGPGRKVKADHAAGARWVLS